MYVRPIAVNERCPIANKFIHWTYDSARMEAERLNIINKPDSTKLAEAPYGCKHCHGWHVGKGLKGKMDRPSRMMRR